MINLSTVTVRRRLVNKVTGGPAADDSISSVLILSCCEISCPSSDKLLHFDAPSVAFGRDKLLVIIYSLRKTEKRRDYLDLSGTRAARPSLYLFFPFSENKID